MPIIQGKSKKTFNKNVETEMKAGKPQDQSLAIAYSIQRKNKSNKKKMAYGGMAEATNEPSIPKRKPDDEQIADSESMASHFAQGGDVEASDLMSDDERASSIADAIMRKRKAKKYADGGMVDIQENGREQMSTPYDEDNHEAVMKELYDDAQLGAQPEDSNEHAVSIEEDGHDIVSKIRSKMRMKRS